MFVINWSDLFDGAVLTLDLHDPVANPDGIVLHFDDDNLAAYDLYITVNDDLDVVTITDFYTLKTVTFNVDVLTVTTSNVTFADGSKILFGDNSYGTASDNAGNTLVGGSGSDQLIGLAGNDSLVGSGGRDVFVDPYGSNTLVGGGGNDWFIVYSEVGSANTVTGGTGQDVYHVDEGSPSLLTGFQSHAYRVTDFTPGSGGDIIFASEFLYYLATGYVDQDPFAAGFLRFRQSGSNTLLQGDRDGATGGTYGWATLITLENISPASLTLENYPDLVVGTGGNDLLTGTDRDERNEGDDLIPGLFGNDTLKGLSGSDYLTGAAGNDVLNGGSGADSLLGGSGRDLYYVDHVNDQVVEDSNGPAALNEEPEALDDFTDTVVAAVSYSLADVQFVENLTLNGGATSGTGNELQNKLTGNSLHNKLSGLGGSDTLDGGGGRDTMKGGPGNDVYYVNVAGDVVTEGISGGIDEIRTTVTLATLAANVENLRLIGTASINGYGNALANTITGNSAGNAISGGGGHDVLTGAGGADRFVFRSALNANSNVDEIVDFELTDRIQLDGHIFLSLSAGNLPVSAFYVGAAAHDATDRIIYNSGTGRLFYDADGNEPGAKVLFATLRGAPMLAADDFEIIA